MKLNVRLWLIVAFLSLFSLEMLAQQNRFKNERRIYLWDVTLSMKGYQDKTPDIYDKVVDALEKDINSVLDEQTEIWVLPFQTSALAKWHDKATAAGKKKLIDQIKAFKNEEVTNTNITVPMQDVMSSLVKDDCRNVLILLTDGQQNASGYPMSTLLDLIRKWCSFAQQHDAYAFYVMLTKYATQPDLIHVIDETCRITKVIAGEDMNLNFVELLPQGSSKFNVKDDAGKKMRIKVDCKKRVSIPDGLKIHCYCDSNPYVEIDEEVSIQKGAMDLDVKLKQPYEELKKNLPQDSNHCLKIYFEVDNPDKYPLVQLLNEECALELINKPEKMLKIYVKD